MSRLSRWVMAVAVLACSTNAWAGQAQPPAERRAWTWSRACRSSRCRRPPAH